MGYEWYVTPQEYEIAEQNGISAKNLNNRIRQFGWHKERAMTEPYRQRRDLSEWGKIAESNGIQYRTMQTRIARGWSIEDAATKPLFDMKTQMKQLKQNNRKYPDVESKLKEIGITYAAFTNRMRSGWTLEDAMKTVKMSNQESALVGKERSGWTTGPSLFVKKGARV